MADVHSPETRSFNMSRIHGKDTKPEELVRKYLFFRGFRYRKNDKRLPGKPDIVLPKYRTVIFVNGCFWHMHENCKDFVMPKSNVDFWTEKLNGNVARDKINREKLVEQGWNVLVIWSCELKRDLFDIRMKELVNQIMNQKAKQSHNGDQKDEDT